MLSTILFSLYITKKVEQRNKPADQDYHQHQLLIVDFQLFIVTYDLGN